MAKKKKCNKLFYILVVLIPLTAVIQLFTSESSLATTDSSKVIFSSLSKRLPTLSLSQTNPASESLLPVRDWQTYYSQQEQQRIAYAQRDKFKCQIDDFACICRERAVDNTVLLTMGNYAYLDFVISWTQMVGVCNEY